MLLGPKRTPASCRYSALRSLAIFLGILNKNWATQHAVIFASSSDVVATKSSVLSAPALLNVSGEAGFPITTLKSIRLPISARAS